MPKAKSVNTFPCRKMDMVEILKRNYAMSVKQLMRSMKMSERSVRRYLAELIDDRVVFMKYTMRRRGSLKPINYYSMRRK